jgi:hypothetical protein
MAWRRTSASLLTNAVANPLLMRLLKSRAGRLPGRRLAVVEYDGRRSGQLRRLVTGYARDGSTVVITAGRPERKTWWRNFETAHPVRLRLAGEDHEAVARVVRDGGVRVVADLRRTP